jgi:hypothetical protein
MSQIKCIAIALSVVGFGFGIASAVYWWKSSREAVSQYAIPPIIAHGSPVITARQLEDYLRRVGALNAKAAIFGAIGVLFATIAGIVATVGS